MKVNFTIIKTVVFTLFVSQSLLLRSQYVTQDENRHAHFRAVFLYSFTRYFKWTNIGQLTEFRFGVVGADSALMGELKLLAERKKVSDLPIKIISFNTPGEVSQTEVLLVDMAQFPKYKIPSSSRNTLIVSQNSGDINNTMIAFIESEGKLKFAFNSRVTEKAGLEYNPDFLALATVVVGRNDGKRNDITAVCRVLCCCRETIVGRIDSNGVIDLAIHQTANACAASVVIDDGISGAHARIAGKGHLVGPGMSGRYGTGAKYLSGGRSRRLESMTRTGCYTANECDGNRS